jgi:predicted Zn-dependent peptidase
MYCDTYKNPTGLVSIGAFIHVGSIDETQKEKGYSHFLEHMLFTGTEDYPNTSELTAKLSDLGCEFNAHTSYEYTAFHITLHKEHFDEAFKLFKSMLENPVFNSEDLEREKKVVCQEIELSDNKSVLYKAHKKMLGMIYGASTLKTHFNILGSKKNIQSAKRKDIVDYWKKWYTQPNQKLIVISGDANISKTASKFPQRKTVKKFERQEGPKIAKLKQDKLGSAYIYWGFYTADFETDIKKTIILELLLKYLCQSLNSMIAKSLRIEAGLSYTTRCLGSNSFFSYLSGGYGYKGFVVSISNDKINLGYKKVISVIEDVCTNGINEEALDSVKNRFIVGFNSLMQTTLSRMFYYGTMAMKYSGNVQPDDIINIAKSIAVNDFNMLVCEVLSPARRYCVLVTRK